MNPTNFFKNKETLSSFKNKTVLIFGGGNASYELGNIFLDVKAQ